MQSCEEFETTFNKNNFNCPMNSMKQFFNKEWQEWWLSEECVAVSKWASECVCGWVN